MTTHKTGHDAASSEGTVTATVNAPRRTLPCSSDPDLGGPHRHIGAVTPRDSAVHWNGSGGRWSNSCRYENFGLRKTYSAAILPSRTTATSRPVYSGGSPFGPEPHARIPPLCRAWGSPCGVYAKCGCVARSSPANLSSASCPTNTHPERTTRNRLYRTLQRRRADGQHHPPRRPPEGFDTEDRQFVQSFCVLSACVPVFGCAL